MDDQQRLEHLRDQRQPIIEQVHYWLQRLDQSNDEITSLRERIDREAKNCLRVWDTKTHRWI